jgi:hypothetical protein
VQPVGSHRRDRTRTTAGTPGVDPKAIGSFPIAGPGAGGAMAGEALQTAGMGKRISGRVWRRIGSEDPFQRMLQSTQGGRARAVSLDRTRSRRVRPARLVVVTGWSRRGRAGPG